MKIGIMGTPVECGNRGVMALGASLVSLCSSGSPHTEVVLLLGNRDDQPASFRVDGELQAIPVVHCRLSPRCGLRDHFVWILFISVIYRLVPIAVVRTVIVQSTPWIRAVAETDFVGDIRGGDSFSDIYGFRRFLLGFLMASTVLLVKGTIVQFPQTYGPYKRRVSRVLARFLLKRSCVIIARDRESQKVAQELVGPDQKVLLSPDVAFSLEAIQPEQIELDPPLSAPISSLQASNSQLYAPNTLLAPGAKLPALTSSVPTPSSKLQASNSRLHAPLIGLNVNGLMYNGGYTRGNMFGLKMDYPTFLPQLVSALLAEHPGELWLIPHTYAPHGDVESDNEASAKLRETLPSALRDRVRLVSAEYDQHELKWLIGQCDFFVGSRMHSCIAALSQGVPCVGVAYSMKFRGVFESVGMEDWVVDARSCANDDALCRVLSLYRTRNQIRRELRKEADKAREQLVQIFKELVLDSLPGRRPIPVMQEVVEPLTR